MRETDATMTPFYFCHKGATPSAVQVCKTWTPTRLLVMSSAGLGPHTWKFTESNNEESESGDAFIVIKPLFHGVSELQQTWSELQRELQRERADLLEGDARRRPTFMLRVCVVQLHLRPIMHHHSVSRCRRVADWSEAVCEVYLWMWLDLNSPAVWAELYCPYHVCIICDVTSWSVILPPSPENPAESQPPSSPPLPVDSSQS